MDENYEENKSTTRPTGVHFIKLNNNIEREENHLEQQCPWLLNNTFFCYDVETSIMKMRKNNTFYIIRIIIKLPKKLTQKGHEA